MADAITLAVDLLHHAVHIHALGNAVPVSPVCTGNAVVVMQMLQHTHGYGFLSGIQMHESRNVSPGKIDVQTLLEIADRAHLPVHIQQCLPVERRFMTHIVLLLCARARNARTGLGGAGWEGALPMLSSVA